MTRKVRGHDRTGRSKGTDHFTKMIRRTMEEPAWRALSSVAQALYPWLKLEWRGADFNNNGKIRLSVRQAAERLGVSVNTAARGFHDLQAKGFIVVTEPACLGVRGMARAPAYELTELALPNDEQRNGRKLYREWRPGKDSPVEKHGANNPAGCNGKNKTLSSKRGRACHQNGYVSPDPITKMKTGRHQNGDVQPNSGSAFVTKMKTSLYTRSDDQSGVPDLSISAGLYLCPLLAGETAT
jgi:hypothetical protein